jgi:hypothetical protein
MFEAFLYALAIIAVLIVRANPTPATEAPTAAPEAPQTTAPAPAPAPAPAMAQAISQPVATLTIRTEAPSTDYSTLKTPQLRKLCSQRGITWRNAHGKKHLRNAEMIEMLQALAA